MISHLFSLHVDILNNKYKNNKINIIMSKMNDEFFENEIGTNKSILNLIFPNKHKPIIWDN